MDKLTIWKNQRFDDATAKVLKDRVRPHEIVWSASASASMLVAGSRDPAALTADILYGQPDPADVLESKKVKWVQLTSAGYTRYDSAGFKQSLKSRQIAFCNASSLFDEPCAQHAAALLLSLSRALPLAVLDKASGAWNFTQLRRQSFLLGGQKTLIVGYGAIARRLVELLSPYGLHMTAFRRTVRNDENLHTVPIAEIDAYLPTADIIINILPASDATKHFFDHRRLSAVKPGLVYISIGRGDTTDQTALVDLLASGHMHYAYLDVTTPEPLPPEHPLWTTPNCYITPHTAGGTFDEPTRMSQHFLDNFDRYLNQRPLSDRLI